MLYQGSCHCGAVQFEVDAPEEIEVEDCNCSICAKSGFLHLIVPTSKFRLTSGEDKLTHYSFNTGVADHMFCATCGIKPFLHATLKPRWCQRKCQMLKHQAESHEDCSVRRSELGTKCPQIVAQICERMMFFGKFRQGDKVAPVGSR